MPLVSSLAVGEIAGEGFASKGTSYGGGSTAWRRVASIEKKREKAYHL